MRSERRLHVLLALSLVGFVVIALDVTQHGLLERHDMGVGLWVYDHTPDSVVRAANAITQLGGVWSIVSLTAIGVAVLLRRGRRGDALLLACSVGLGSLVTRVLKLAFDRPRPTIGEPKALSHTAAFPNGHTAGARIVFVLSRGAARDAMEAAGSRRCRAARRAHRGVPVLWSRRTG